MQAQPSRGAYRASISSGPPRAGSFDKFLNVQITLIILLQILMCALHGSLALWWRNQHANNRYYLATTVQGQARFATWGTHVFQAHQSCEPLRNEEQRSI